jgi:hypothetical protein
MSMARCCAARSSAFRRRHRLQGDHVLRSPRSLCPVCRYSTSRYTPSVARLLRQRQSDNATKLGSELSSFHLTGRQKSTTWSLIFQDLLLAIGCLSRPEAAWKVVSCLHTRSLARSRFGSMSKTSARNSPCAPAPLISNHPMNGTWSFRISERIDVTDRLN